MLAQPGDETPQHGNATVEALYVLDSPGSLNLVDCLDLVRISLDSPV
jgi:hypothetical protein